MHILMISDVYFPRINGVSTSIATFRRALQRKGHRVTLVAPDYGQGRDEDERIVRIPARSVVVDPEDRMMKATKILRNVQALPSMMPFLHVLQHPSSWYQTSCQTVSVQHRNKQDILHEASE